MNLAGLDSLSSLVVKDINKPTNIDTIYYLFWKRGISLKEFNELPLPYIFSILNTHRWIKKEEEKQYKKSNRKR